MKDVFEIAVGSVTGADHRWSGKNNQDAYHCLVDDKLIIAVVCDGCSEGTHNEVGSNIGAKLIARNIQKHLTSVYPKDVRDAVEISRRETIEQLKFLASAMGGSSRSQLVTDYFLFTAIVLIIGPEVTAIFSIGDGVYSLNGETTRLGPFQANEPPYLAYGGLVESSLATDRPDLLCFRPNEMIFTNCVNTVLIGSDGVVNFIESSGLKLPGKEEDVGDISQFWLDDRYFLNRDMVRRRLFLASREYSQPIWSEQRLSKAKGLLPDDTTLIVVRRKKS